VSGLTTGGVASCGDFLANALLATIFGLPTTCLSAVKGLP
jgi:hypothetical protein